MTIEELQALGLAEQEIKTVIDTVLDSVKKDFVRTVIHQALKNVENQLKNHPAVWTSNGSLKVDWSCEDQDKPYEADRLIWQNNVLNCILAKLW